MELLQEVKAADRSATMIPLPKEKAADPERAGQKKMENLQTTARLQGFLDRLASGDNSARNPLLEHSLARLQTLASRMFKTEFNLRAIEQTDDVLQKALIRLHRALEAVKPNDVKAYFGLAARQIRFVLLDLVKQSETRPLAFGNLEEFGPEETSNRLSISGDGPQNLLEWADFHRAVDSLPDEQRQMFDLLVYQGLTQPEAATITGLSLRTVKRVWSNARLALRERLPSGTR